MTKSRSGPSGKLLRGMRASFTNAVSATNKRDDVKPYACSFTNGCLLPVHGIQFPTELQRSTKIYMTGVNNVEQIRELSCYTMPQDAFSCAEYQPCEQVLLDR